MAELWLPKCVFKGEASVLCALCTSRIFHIEELHGRTTLSHLMIWVSPNLQTWDRNNRGQANADGGRDRTIAFSLESSRRFWGSIIWVDKSSRKQWTSVFLNLKVSFKRSTLKKQLDCPREFWMHQWTAEAIQQKDASSVSRCSERRIVLQAVYSSATKADKAQVRFSLQYQTSLWDTRWNSKEKIKSLFNSVQSFLSKFGSKPR